MNGCTAHGARVPRADRERPARGTPASAAAAPYAIEPVDEPARRTRLQKLREFLTRRIVVLDGAMGTMIQQHRLDEAGLPRRAAAPARL